MKLRFFACGLAAMFALATVAPVAAADKETRQMMADIRMLQEQEQQIESALTALTDMIKTTNASLNARIDEQTEATRKALADEKTVTTSMSSDLRALREKVDDVTTRVGSQTVEIQALRQLITSRSALPAPDAAPAGSPDTAPTAAAATPAAQGASPTAMFDEAYGDYTAGLFDLAEAGFKGFINSYPSAPKAADAQVYICDSYYTDGKFPEAVDACDTAIRNYPKGASTARAYYHKALALQSLKQTDAANTAFDFIIKTWPDSQEATLAAQKRTALKKP